MDPELSTFVTGFFVVFLVVVLIIAWASLRNIPVRKAWEKKLHNLEFVEIKEAPPEVFQSVVSLYRCSSRYYKPDRFNLWSVHEKRVQNGSFYVFDLMERARDGDWIWLGAGMIAVVSPYLNLPYLSIAARGSSAGLVNAAFRKVGQIANVFSSEFGQLKQVSLKDTPDIDRQLLVMAEDEFAAWEFLTPARLADLTWLADKEHQCQIECGGNCFALRPLLTRANSFTKADPQWMVDGAECLWTLFSS